MAYFVSEVALKILICHLIRPMSYAIITKHNSTYTTINHFRIIYFHAGTQITLSAL